MTYSRLFTPITIGNMTLKNRIVMPAMSREELETYVQSNHRG